MNQTEVKLDGIWGGDASYPGKPSCTGIGSCRQYHKTDPIRRTRNGKGAEGGRFTGSTYNPGPEKPGNRVEDKILEIGKVTFRKDILHRDPAVKKTYGNHNICRKSDFENCQAWTFPESR